MTRSHLVGVSMPRSGHHYLARLLSFALEPDLVYCEFYTPLDCCRSVPCTRHAEAGVVFQKNHDFDFSVPPDLQGVTYVVQHRAPVLGALSDREYLALLEGRDRADDRDEFVVWLGRKAAYIHRFWEKWLRPERTGRIVVDYPVLLERPAEVLETIVGALGLPIDHARFDRAVSMASGLIADFPAVVGRSPVFKPRRLEASRYFDQELLSAFESVVLRVVPELEATRVLPAMSPPGHPVALVYEAEMRMAAGRPAAAGESLMAAVQASSENPHLWHALAAAHHVAGDVGAAQAAQAEAIRRRPDHPLFLRAVSNLHRVRAEQESVLAIETARRLVAQHPSDPGHMIHLASLLSGRGEETEAVSLAAVVIGLGSRDPLVWREASEIFFKVESWESGLEAIRGALLRDSGNAEFRRHLARLLARVGLTDEAIVELTQALSLTPRMTFWRRRLAELLINVRRVDEAVAVLDEGLALDPGEPSLASLREHCLKLDDESSEAASSPVEGPGANVGNWSSPPTRADVRMAYHLLLGRAPEDEHAIRHHVNTHADRRALIRAFIASREFMRALPDVVSLALDLKARAGSLFAHWAPAGATEPPDPAFWLDALGVRTRCAYRTEWADRGGTVQRGADDAPLEWLALLEALDAAGDEFCLVELGAGHGPWLARGGVAWRRRYPERSLRLVGVEAEPSHFGFLRQHVADNELGGDAVRLVEGAVAARDGTIEFETSCHPEDDWGTRAAMDTPPAGLPRVADAGRTTVLSWSVGSLAADLGRIDLLHMDIQGSEVEVLEGAEGVLRAKVARLFVGTHSRIAEGRLMERLPPLGFALVGETPCQYGMSGPAPTLERDGGQYWVKRRL